MIEIENWWLLAIPLFFVLGWLASRFEQRAVLRDKGRLPDAYSKGLNFLLNEQSDKAVDAFVDVVRIEPDAIETHFALGNLFRRRGETDRAIRVHQNLVERKNLPDEQRDHALFELGQDFLKAGLLDRAEDVFNRLEGTQYGPAALHHRLEITQMVRDWTAAIAIAERLERDFRENHRREIAHFHCELAQKRLAGKEPGASTAARNQAEIALQVDSEHARAHLLRGQIAFQDSDFELAICAWEDLLRYSPAHLALVVVEWLGAHRAINKSAAGIEQAENLLSKHPSSDIFAALAEAKAAENGAEAAQIWAEQQLRKTPSLLGLEKLLALRAQSAPNEQHGDMELIQKMIQAQARRLSRYVCNHCGFKARQFYWQCAGCNRWDTYAPKRSEELEV